jgi:hypothetical protein
MHTYCTDIIELVSKEKHLRAKFTEKHLSAKLRNFEISLCVLGLRASESVRVYTEISVSPAVLGAASTKSPKQRQKNTRVDELSQDP